MLRVTTLVVAVGLLISSTKLHAAEPTIAVTPGPTATPELADRFKARVELLKQNYQQLGQKRQQAEAQLEAIKQEMTRIEGAAREIGAVMGEE